MCPVVSQHWAHSLPTQCQSCRVGKGPTLENSILKCVRVQLTWQKTFAWEKKMTLHKKGELPLNIGVFGTEAAPQSLQASGSGGLHWFHQT